MVFAGLLTASSSSKHDRPASSRPGGGGASTSAASASASGLRPRLPSPRSSSTAPLTSSNATSSSPSLSPTLVPATKQQQAHSREYIADETELRPVPDDAPDLRELNNCLEALAAVFPDVQVDVFREMLTSFDGESRLAVVAEALLKNRVSWVKGRWKVANSAGGEGTGTTKKDSAAPIQPMAKEGAPAGEWADTDGCSLVPTRELFRSKEYKDAVKALAFHEFKGLSRSTIVAVLAESNYSYLDARNTLVDISSKSWRFAMASFFRKKPTSASSAEAAESHPLVVWKSSGKGSILPTIRSTGSPELDRELYAELVAPLKRKARVAQEEKDRVLAIVLNMEEAEEADATHECACCFTTATFEEITTCNASCHVLCFRCVQHSISEAVFGQGWQRSIDRELGALRCPAVDSDECAGCIPPDQMHRAMLGEKNGAEVLHRLDQRLAEHDLIASGLPLVRCPFCSYAEVDELYLPSHESHLRVRADSVINLAFLLLCVAVVPFLLLMLLLSSLVCLLLTSRRAPGDQLVAELRAALTRHRRRRRGLKFVCQDPSCGRTSCLSCSKAWADIHTCHESALVAMRTQVEQAMSLAIKRVCPRCNTSFVKTAGCNKLTCPCGYKMCYVCRKDIGDGAGAGDVGYRHFCDHFRPEGDPRPCDQCSKCNLWEAENTEAVLRAAKEEAERKWLEAEGHALDGAGKALLDTGLSPLALRGGGKERRAGGGGWPSLARVCDVVVENTFV